MSSLGTLISYLQSVQGRSFSMGYDEEFCSEFETSIIEKEPLILHQPTTNTLKLTKIPSEVVYSASLIPHVKQVVDWDCGLASVSMILNALGCSVQPQNLLQRVSPLDSIWTIDLAYLLLHYGAKEFTYYTSHIGVNYQLSKYPFYQDSLNRDHTRIHALFAAAPSNGLRVAPLNLRLDDLKRFLVCADECQSHYAVILLVDLPLLKCQSCCTVQPKRKIKWKKWLMKTLSRACFFLKEDTTIIRSDEFVGHYIVLFAYDSNQDYFYYRDPGCDEEMCWIKSIDLDAARCSPGTDHDAIVIKIH